jgi:hypothetical protein
MTLKISIKPIDKMVKLVLLVTLFFSSFPSPLKAQQTIIQYLSGTDKDHTVAWNFYCTSGMNSGKWSTIQVPSNWEQQKFGTYNYYKDEKNPGETGMYKYHFKSSPLWKHKKVVIVFEGAMTDTDVRINGLSAGSVHQGGFCEFKYDITGLIKTAGDNLLEVTVSKHSANESVNQAERKADFWLFGGIYRPVYLEILPDVNIERIAVNAMANGDLSMQVLTNHSTNNQTIEAQLQELNGVQVENAFNVKASDSAILKYHFSDIKKWNPEQPNLYKLLVSIKEQGKVIHTITQRIGFRTAELRLQDGFYLNGTKVIFKGVNRHSEWPETGRTLSREIHLMDIGLIKEMNMNAVRMSHYPPNKEFLDLCDSIGLFVLDELTGWQAAYDTVVGRKLVRELVVRDVNHPSVVIWDNGNEGGWNRELDNDYQLYDPQKRLVIHPWEKFNGTDTKHYPDYNYIVNSVLYGKEVFFPTEFMHGLFDGGHGAGLDDFWSEMMKHPHAAGGFLWSLHDEGIMRKDRNDTIDVAGNSAPDGIVGPHREKEGSFFTIKEIWSPVQIEIKKLPEQFDGKLLVENRYLFTNLSQCRFEWKLVKLPLPGVNTTIGVIVAEGKANSIALAPGEKGWMQLNLPASAGLGDVLCVTAHDPFNKEIFTWSWPLKSAATIARAIIPPVSNSQVEAIEQGNELIVKQDGIACYFDKATGLLLKVTNQQSTISLSNGPIVTGEKQLLKELKHYKNGAQYIVEPVYEGNSYFAVKWVFHPGQPVKLEYAYSQRGEQPCSGISFNYPEESIIGMKWLGRGPYHVWKNRLKGQQFGVWYKKFNNTITGESWQYPEFKGYHAEMNWVVIESKEASFKVYTDQEGLFLQMLKTPKPVKASNENVSPAFAAGNLGFMNAISPIGTKFQSAEKMGPQSQLNIQLNYSPVKGSLWFDF